MTGYCRRCGKKARGKMQIANAERYAPFCSYQCQQYWNLDEAREYLAAIGIDHLPCPINRPLEAKLKKESRLEGGGFENFLRSYIGHDIED